MDHVIALGVRVRAVPGEREGTLQQFENISPESEALDFDHPGGNPGANLKSISHRCYLAVDLNNCRFAPTRSRREGRGRRGGDTHPLGVRPAQ